MPATDLEWVDFVLGGLFFVAAGLILYFRTTARVA
jgi:hypothetical protein